MIFAHSILSGYMVLQGSYVVHIPMLITMLLLVRDMIPTDDEVVQVMFRGSVIPWFWCAVTMHILLGLLSILKVFTGFADSFQSGFKSIQLIFNLLEALNFCKMLQLYGNSKMSHHEKESKEVQDFRFWILIEICMVCITVGVPIIFLFFRQWLIRDQLRFQLNNRSLSDETKIAGTTWKELKTLVMPRNYFGYRGELWFNNLSVEEKDLLEELRFKQQE